MPPVGFKRSRALWDNARRPHGHWSAAAVPWCRAVLYELQPVRRSQLPDMRLVRQRLAATVRLLVQVGLPRTCQAVTTWIGQRSRREWMWLTAALVYYAAVRWIHSVLEAGPVVLIITALIAIFTIGLSDEGNADGISAYAVFNRGFRRLLGTVEADDLVAQHMGGGGMRIPLQQQQQQDNNILQAPLPPRRRAAAAAAEAQPNPDDAPGAAAAAAEDVDDENNNNNQDNVNDNNQPRRRLPGKKARRRNLEQRRELQLQREAARAMGFDDENEQGEALALQRLLDQENE